MGFYGFPGMNGPFGYSNYVNSGFGPMPNGMTPQTHSTNPHGPEAPEKNKNGFGAFFRGIKNGFTNTVKSFFTLPGFLTTAATIAGVALFGGAVLFPLMALGVGIGGYQFIKGAVNGDAEKMGEGVFTLGATALGGKLTPHKIGAYELADTSLWGKLKAPFSGKGTFKNSDVSFWQAAGEEASAGWKNFSGKFYTGKAATPEASTAATKPPLRGILKKEDAPQPPGEVVQKTVRFNLDGAETPETKNTGWANFDEPTPAIRPDTAFDGDVGSIFDELAPVTHPGEETLAGATLDESSSTLKTPLLGDSAVDSAAPAMEAELPQAKAPLKAKDSKGLRSWFFGKKGKAATPVETPETGKSVSKSTLKPLEKTQTETPIQSEDKRSFMSKVFGKKAEKSASKAVKAEMPEATAPPAEKAKPGFWKRVAQRWTKQYPGLKESQNYFLGKKGAKTAAAGAPEGAQVDFSPDAITYLKNLKKSAKEANMASASVFGSMPFTTSEAEPD